MPTELVSKLDLVVSEAWRVVLVGVGVVGLVVPLMSPPDTPLVDIGVV